MLIILPIMLCCTANAQCLPIMLNNVIHVYTLLKIPTLWIENEYRIAGYFPEFPE